MSGLVRKADTGFAGGDHYRDKSFFVTGATGFLGGHIVRLLRESGVSVISGVRGGAVESSDRTLVVDLADLASIDATLERVRPTHIINCAAYGVDQREQDYAAAFAVNVSGAVELVRAAAKASISRIIHIGSCSEYGSSDKPIPEGAPQKPYNLYAISKAAGTLAVLEAGARTGVEVIVVRPFGLWGPGEPEFRVIPQVVAACRTRSPLALTECDVVRDYSFIADAAGWIVRVAFSEKIKSGAIVNIGTGRPLLLRDFVLDVASRMGGADLMQFGKRPQRPNEPKSHVADVSRLTELIGSLKETSLDDGLHWMLNERRA